MDAFGKPDIEIVYNVLDPTPVYVSDEEEDFYRDMSVEKADIVVVRGSDPDVSEILSDHYEICSRVEGPDIYLGNDAPSDFPSMNPYKAEKLVQEDVEDLVDRYLETGDRNQSSF